MARLRRAGFRIAPGFCVTVAAYEQFLRDTQLQLVVQMELGRKPFGELRWEELWDTALRIRNRFAVANVPLSVAQSIYLYDLRTITPEAVRLAEICVACGAWETRVAASEAERVVPSCRLQ